MFHHDASSRRRPDRCVYAASLSSASVPIGRPADMSPHKRMGQRRTTHSNSRVSGNRTLRVTRRHPRSDSLKRKRVRFPDSRRRSTSSRVRGPGPQLRHPVVRQCQPERARSGSGRPQRGTSHSGSIVSFRQGCVPAGFSGSAKLDLPSPADLAVVGSRRYRAAALATASAKFHGIHAPGSLATSSA